MQNNHGFNLKKNFLINTEAFQHAVFFFCRGFWRCLIPRVPKIIEFTFLSFRSWGEVAASPQAPGPSSVPRRQPTWAWFINSLFILLSDFLVKNEMRRTHLCQQLLAQNLVSQTTVLTGTCWSCCLGWRPMESRHADDHSRTSWTTDKPHGLCFLLQPYSSSNCNNK